MYSLKNNIIKTLVYFDIFQYPLLKQEILFFLQQKCTEQQLDHVLISLQSDKIIYREDEYYSLQNDCRLAERRTKGNIKAEEQLKIAVGVGRWLSQFPYVRGIGISGSLSKNFADEKSDIDFFIITAENRLWIARTLMHILKKLSFLFGKQHWFCMNYYIDLQAMEIIEKNIYTATEIATLLPLNGKKIFSDFIYANKWICKYFPNAIKKEFSSNEIKNGFIKRLMEWLFNNATGNNIDNWLMKITAKRWYKKTIREKRNRRGIIMGMKADKHYAKPDPKNFQLKIIQQYYSKIDQILKNDEIIISSAMK